MEPPGSQASRNALDVYSTKVTVSVRDCNEAKMKKHDKQQHEHEIEKQFENNKPWTDVHLPVSEALSHWMSQERLYVRASKCQSISQSFYLQTYHKSFYNEFIRQQPILFWFQCIRCLHDIIARTILELWKYGPIRIVLLNMYGYRIHIWDNA